MAEREQNYWWHLGRLRIIQTYVELLRGDKEPLDILNVGCGTGGTITMLERFGPTKNVDISDEAIRFMNQKGYNEITKVKAIALPFEDKVFDMVGAFDVLEHIEEDVKALKEWKRVLKPNGAILITVPAYQWLWSNHDVSLHHKRRYNLKRLRKTVRQAGLSLDKTSYAIVFSLPLVVGFRFLNKILRRQIISESSYVDVPSWMNRFFTYLLYVEAHLHKIISLPAGTSIVAVIRNQADRPS